MLQGDALLFISVNALGHDLTLNDCFAGLACDQLHCSHSQQQICFASASCRPAHCGQQSVPIRAGNHAERSSC